MWDIVSYSQLIIVNFVYIASTLLIATLAEAVVICLIGGVGAGMNW